MAEILLKKDLTSQVTQPIIIITLDLDSDKLPNVYFCFPGFRSERISKRLLSKI